MQNYDILSIGQFNNKSNRTNDPSSYDIDYNAQLPVSKIVSKAISQGQKSRLPLSLFLNNSELSPVNVVNRSISYANCTSDTAIVCVFKIEGETPRSLNQQFFMTKRPIDRCILSVNSSTGATFIPGVFYLFLNWSVLRNGKVTDSGLINKPYKLGNAGGTINIERDVGSWPPCLVTISNDITTPNTWVVSKNCPDMQFTCQLYEGNKPIDNFTINSEGPSAVVSCPLAYAIVVYSEEDNVESQFVLAKLIQEGNMLFFGNNGDSTIVKSNKIVHIPTENELQKVARSINADFGYNNN